MTQIPPSPHFALGIGAAAHGVSPHGHGPVGRGFAAAAAFVIAWGICGQQRSPVMRTVQSSSRVQPGAGLASATRGISHALPLDEVAPPVPEDDDEDDEDDDDDDDVVGGDGSLPLPQPAPAAHAALAARRTALRATRILR